MKHPLRRGSSSVEAGVRSGKILVLFAVLLPALFCVMALFLDAGLLLVEVHRCQHVADAAATSAALQLLLEEDDPETTAIRVVRELNRMPEARVVTYLPPRSGTFAGQEGYIEVRVQRTSPGFFLRGAGLDGPNAVEARAVAGLRAVTEPAAIVILDENPPPLHVAPLPITIPSATPLLGGLEVLGLGRLHVRGSILVNNRWGGLDEYGNPLLMELGLSNACSCTPMLPLTQVKAPDIRVVGGVDNPANYLPLDPGRPSPLKTNRRPTPDPYAHLPVPTTTVDPSNVKGRTYGGVTVVNLPLLQPPHVLRPGVYDWIAVVSGRVVFEPGVYIIRGRHPVTQIGLNLLTGTIRAEGVLFYLTDAANYSTVTGWPDSPDGPTAPNPTPLTLAPAALIDTALLNSRFSGLDDPRSPFHGLLIYQRRTDRRPIILVQQELIGMTNVSGNVYARSSHLLLTANGTYRSAFVVGSLRVASILETRIEPETYLPPAYDVSLVE